MDESKNAPMTVIHTWNYSHAPRDDWENGHDYADWIRSKGFELGELTKDPAGVPAEVHQTTWCAEKTIDFIEQNRNRNWFASVNIYDPHPPFNPPQAYRDLFDPATVKPPLFRESDLAQQKKLESIDFQSVAQHPDALDIKSPILPQSPSPRPGGGRLPGRARRQQLNRGILCDDKVD